MFKCKLKLIQYMLVESSKPICVYFVCFGVISKIEIQYENERKKLFLEYKEIKF